MAQAQQERRARQQERDRIQAARTLQRVWRGHATRDVVRNEYRQIWDDRDSQLRLRLSQEPSCKRLQSDETLSHLRLLLQFATHRNRGDVQRISLYTVLFDRFLQASSTKPLDVKWSRPLSKLAKIILSIFKSAMSGINGLFQDAVINHHEVNNMIDFLMHMVKSFPHEICNYPRFFYSVLGKVLLSKQSLDSDLTHQKLLEILGLPLQKPAESSAAIYEGFIVELLTVPSMQNHLNLHSLARDLNPRFLNMTLNSITLSKSSTGLLQTLPRRKVSWLLAYFIYIRSILATNNTSVYVSDIDFVAVVSALLSHLAEDIGQQSSSHRSSPSIDPMPQFVQDQIMTLVNQENITGLLTHSGILIASTAAPQKEFDEASIFAGYVLTLLQVFPRRSDEIRMWLYLGSTRSQAGQGGTTNHVPAIRFFWDAVTRTHVYQAVCADSRALTNSLHGHYGNDSITQSRPGIEQEWRIILIFLELYTFVLKVMDDEEFMMGANALTEQMSWTRLSALDLKQVKDLITFLKNFAFAMYWYAPELLNSAQTETTGKLAHYFGQSSPEAKSTGEIDHPSTSNDIVIPGIHWMTLGYLKGMVTGLLRMLYERE